MYSLLSQLSLFLHTIQVTDYVIVSSFPGQVHSKLALLQHKQLCTQIYICYKSQELLSYYMYLTPKEITITYMYTEACACHNTMAFSNYMYICRAQGNPIYCSSHQLYKAEYRYKLLFKWHFYVYMYI